MHLTSNDAIWEAEERGSSTTQFNLIVSIWRKEGEQQGEEGGREREAWQLRIWKQRFVAGGPAAAPSPPSSDNVQLFSPPSFPSTSPFFFLSNLPQSSFPPLVKPPSPSFPPP